MTDFQANLNLWKYPSAHDPLKILGLGPNANAGPAKQEVQQILPFSYPTKQSNVDALSKTVRSRAISLQLFRDVILKNYRKNENRAAEDKAKFDELANEREYFKVYVPTTMERKERLAAEVEDLKEQSHSIINDKQNFERMRSNYESKMVEANNLVKHAETAQQRLGNLEHENERLRSQVSGVNTSQQHQQPTQDHHQYPGAQGGFHGTLVQSAYPNHPNDNSRILPDNILDGKRSGYSDHNNSYHYQQNPLSSHVHHQVNSPPRVSHGGDNYGHQNHNVSYTGSTHGNFTKSTKPVQAQSMGGGGGGGGHNPLNFNYAKQGNF